MNMTPILGWYYRDLSDRAPAWSGVEAFGRFLRENQGSGPRALITEIVNLSVGDVIQLCREKGCYHSLIVTRILFPAPEGILICAHSKDSLDRPLASYDYERAVGYHILGWQA